MKGVYSKSDVNKIIDSLLHPLINEYPFLRLVDGLLHAINENNPKESLEKFVRYHGYELIEEIAKWLKK
jgi:hypothetical protein